MSLGDARNGSHAIHDTPYRGFDVLDFHLAPSIAFAVVGLCNLGEQAWRAVVRLLGGLPGLLPQCAASVALGRYLFQIGLAVGQSIDKGAQAVSAHDGSQRVDAFLQSAVGALCGRAVHCPH